MKSVKETDISIISQEIFQHDPSARVENLKVSELCGLCFNVPIISYGHVESVS